VQIDTKIDRQENRYIEMIENRQIKTETWRERERETETETETQPHFSPSVDSLCHPCITAIHLSCSFLPLKLPPPPCAVLLVYCNVAAMTCELNTSNIVQI